MFEVATGRCSSTDTRAWREKEAGQMADVIYVGIPFVFLGLCLLYVRAADKL